MVEIYTVYTPGTNRQQRFTDPKEAGAAFFNEDRANRPSVIHSQEDADAPGGRFGRMMAGTQVYTTYENGETKHTKYNKTLPSSHKGDAEFRAGFMAALEKSVNERLKQTDWEKARLGLSIKDPKLDNNLFDDLGTLVRVDSAKGIKAWKDSVPGWVTPPAYTEPAWKKELAQDKHMGVLAQTTSPSVTPNEALGGDKADTAIRHQERVPVKQVMPVDRDKEFGM